MAQQRPGEKIYAGRQAQCLRSPEVPTACARSRRYTASVRARREASTLRLMQDVLAALSPRGRVVVVEDSGHGIQLDRPDVVIAAIYQVLASTR